MTRQPEIIVVKKCDPFRSCSCDAAVPRRPWSAARIATHDLHTVDLYLLERIQYPTII
jgi:hypothetical protein